MRVVPEAMTTAWKSPLKTGATRPVVRATVQKLNLQKFDYDTALAAGGDFETDRHRRGVFTSAVFGDPSPVKELRNIKHYTWTRSVDQDVATCTLTLFNSEITPIGNQEETEHASDFDMPGYYTYNRGEQTKSQNRWGYTTDTGWQGMLVPDRVVKTYEGYGSDPSVVPALDGNLLQSGVWLIDTVTYTHDGEIVLEMRDLGRLLLDQICFPPVIPYEEYPLAWSKIRSQFVPGRDATGGSFERPSGSDTSSSNDFYIGMGLQDPPYGNYVGPRGGVNGHHSDHALVNREGEYWWSTGQTTAMSKVWWQVDLNSPVPLAALHIHPYGGPYRIYISLKNGNGWIGKKKIPYEVTTEGVDVRAGIPFVETRRIDKKNAFDVILNRKYANIEAIRITFTRLQDTQVGNYPFRAGLRDIMLYTANDVNSLSITRGEVLKVVGNYRDYTDIVKWCCAWAGFFWPPHGTDQDYVQLSHDSDQSPGGRRTIQYSSADTQVLPKGRVWGDFMRSGTAGEAPLSADLFDKKPLMDVVNYARDMLGFVFFIDETGGVVWRMPNIWKKGNYLSPGQLGQRTRARTTDYVVIDENQTLLSYSTTLSSHNIRERIFVANITGKIGTVIKGFIPYRSGMRRMAGWTDQHFETKQETRVMADMIAARQMFDYRRGKVQIPGYPAIQIDDQIRIFERVTNETYYHYVLGVSSNLDMESGEWTYDLDTHWLGEQPSDAWVVRVDELDQATQNYLNLMEE